jgi:hypothetical protein
MNENKTIHFTFFNNNAVQNTISLQDIFPTFVI